MKSKCTFFAIVLAAMAGAAADFAVSGSNAAKACAKLKAAVRVDGVDDVIIASVDGDFTVKTYRRDKDGVRLEPANPEYPVIRLRPGQELDYFGKVTACIHRFAGKR